MKNILCFGDSNTWGYIPKADRILPNTRYPFEVRWTGVAQKELGPEYRLIEEALNGRTTAFHDPVEPHRSGLACLDMILDSQSPLDLVIIFLGCNDTKEHLATTAPIIAQGLRVIVEQILSSSYGPDGAAPKILIAPPIPIGEHIEDTWMITYFNNHSVEKAKQLPSLFEEVAQQYGVAYLNAALYGTPSREDGIHMYPDSHERLGKAFAQKIKELLG